MRIRITNTLVVAIILFLSATNVWAQQTSASEQLEIAISGPGGLVDKLKSVRGQDVAAIQGRKNTFDFRQNLLTIALALTARVDATKRAVLVRTIEEARVDEQVGGSDSNAGSTSLVTKGSVPTILGFAVENGALEREDSGTTLTFRGNFVGIIKALGTSGYIKSYDEDDPSTRFLRTLSFALSFDTSRGPQPGTFTGDLKQLSEYSIHLDVYNKRDPRDKSYLARWNKLINTNAQVVTDILAKITQYLLTDPILADWNEKASVTVATAAENDYDKVVRVQFAKLQTLQLSPQIDTVIESFSTEFNAYLQSRDAVLRDVANGAIVSFDYKNTRNVNEPDLSTFKLIAEGGFFGGKADITANASLTILNKIPVGTNSKRLRDFQMSGQLDLPLGEVQKIGSVVLTFAGKFQHLMDDVQMPDGTIAMNTKGTLGFGQIKLTIPVKGGGVKIPLSVTFANRSELIKEKSFVRGNFGVTFDLDSIFSKLKP
jgi:hypothetical protein